MKRVPPTEKPRYLAVRSHFFQLTYSTAQPGVWLIFYDDVPAALGSATVGAQASSASSVNCKQYTRKVSTGNGAIPNLTVHFSSTYSTSCVDHLYIQHRGKHLPRITSGDHHPCRRNFFHRKRRVRSLGSLNKDSIGLER